LSSENQSKAEGAGARVDGAFPQTRWSVILDAQDDDPAALASFCQAYWFPLYSYARRMGMTTDDAEDLTQAFFERLLSRNSLALARRERGKLRSFLLHSFNNFATEEWRKRGAQKRGGGRPMIEIDALSAEQRYTLEPRDAATPQLEYERAWARQLLRQALDKLAADYTAAGNGAVFNALREQLAGGAADRSYQEIASLLGISEGATRFAAFKLRQRYGAALHEVVAETVASMDEVEAELAHLRTLFQH